jgi:hypothetical protein
VISTRFSASCVKSDINPLAAEERTTFAREKGR